MNIIDFGKVISDRVLSLIETNKKYVEQHREFVAKGMVQFAQQIIIANNQVIGQINRYEPILDHLLAIQKGEKV